MQNGIKEVCMCRCGSYMRSNLSKLRIFWNDWIISGCGLNSKHLKEQRCSFSQQSGSLNPCKPAQQAGSLSESQQWFNHKEATVPQTEIWRETETEEATRRALMRKWRSHMEHRFSHQQHGYYWLISSVTQGPAANAVLCRLQGKRTALEMQVETFFNEAHIV